MAVLNANIEMLPKILAPGLAAMLESRLRKVIEREYKNIVEEVAKEMFQNLSAHIKSVDIGPGHFGDAINVSLYVNGVKKDG